MQNNQLSSSSWLDIIETRSKLIFYLFSELWPIFFQSHNYSWEITGFFRCHVMAKNNLWANHLTLGLYNLEQTLYLKWSNYLNLFLQVYVINGGDRPSQKFHDFVDLCCKSFNIIRKNGNLFLNFFALVSTFSDFIWTIKLLLLTNAGLRPAARNRGFGTSGFLDFF